MRIIGQQGVIGLIDKWSELCSFPRFILISGPKGSGKTLISKYIADKIGVGVEVDIKVDEVRKMIGISQNVGSNVAFILNNVEKMSRAAENSLLKITEEPPKNVYIIATVEDLSRVLPTIKSRGMALKLQPYTEDEIRQYTNGLLATLNDHEKNVISKLCDTPGQVNYLLDHTLSAIEDINEFWKFVQNFQINVGLMHGAECFTVSQKIRLKEEQKGYDLDMFLKAMVAAAMDKVRLIKDIRYYNTICVTAKYMTEFKLQSVNKVSTFDMYILELREIWRERN